MTSMLLTIMHTKKSNEILKTLIAVSGNIKQLLYSHTHLHFVWCKCFTTKTYKEINLLYIVH